MVTGVVPSDSRTDPSVGSPVTVTFSADAAKLASLGATMPIVVVPLFSATVKDVGVVTNGVLFGPIFSVAFPDAVAPVGSETL
jgi:hypothetical protein